MIDIIPTPTRIHRPVRFQTTGLNRGADETLPALGKLAERSQRKFEGVGVDSVPGRSVGYTEAARKHGLVVEPVEGRYEDVRNDGGLERPDLHLLHVDDAVTVTEAIRDAKQYDCAVSGLLMARLPRAGLLAFRFSAAPGDGAAYDLIERFSQSLAAVTSSSGSERFWSKDAPRAFRRGEPALRRWYDQGLETSIPRLLGGQRAPGAVLESTQDGRVTRPVVLLESRTLDDDPMRVAERVAAEASFPLRRGQQFTAIEIANEPEPTIRIRHGRIRRDHLLQVGGAADVTKRDMQRQAEIELAATRIEARRATNPSVGSGGLLLGLALGFGLASALAGLSTRQSPIDLTD